MVDQGLEGWNMSLIPGNAWNYTCSKHWFYGTEIKDTMVSCTTTSLRIKLSNHSPMLIAILDTEKVYLKTNTKTSTL
jgi:hypothetical protein